MLSVLLSVLLAALIVYVSIFIGKILHHTTLEEIKQYKKYITISKDITLILISIIFLLSSNYLTFISLLISFTIFRYFKTQNLFHPFYFFIGLSTFLSFFLETLILSLLSILILLVLFHSSLKPFKLKQILLSSILFILPFGLIFIETFINANLTIFTGLAIGGLLAQLKGP